MNTPSASLLRPGIGLVLLLLALAGCGTLTMGGLAEVEVLVTADEPDPGTFPAAVAGLPPVGRQEDGDDDDDDDDEAEGELEAEFLLYLLAEAGEPVPLTANAVQVQLDLQGDRRFGTGVESVPAGRYTALRAVFLDIEVEVDAGLVVGGDTITGAVDVEQEADTILVDKLVPVELGDEDRLEILLDLNAQTWLNQVDPTARTVAENLFTEAVTVRVRRR